MLALIAGAVVAAYWGRRWRAAVECAARARDCGAARRHRRGADRRGRAAAGGARAVAAALQWRLVAGVLFGLAIGLVSSLLGVAGGELIIPTMVFAFGADIKTAGTASLLISLPTVAVGVLRYAGGGLRDRDRSGDRRPHEPRLGDRRRARRPAGGQHPGGALKVGLGVVLIGRPSVSFSTRALRRHAARRACLPDLQGTAAHRRPATAASSGVTAHEGIGRDVAGAHAEIALRSPQTLAAAQPPPLMNDGEAAHEAAPRDPANCPCCLSRARRRPTRRTCAAPAGLPQPERTRRPRPLAGRLRAGAVVFPIFVNRARYDHRGPAPFRYSCLVRTPSVQHGLRGWYSVRFTKMRNSTQDWAGHAPDGMTVQRPHCVTFSASWR